MRNQQHFVLYDQQQFPDAKKFLEYYEVQNLFLPPPGPLTGLKEKHKRVCKFCKRTSPEVTFEKEAHIIPHLLGNKYLISDFECDYCNKIFSVYEAQLANYLGISRTLWKLKGKNGVPNFYSPGNLVSATKEDFFNLKDAIILSAPKYNFDLKSGVVSIYYDKNPYKPLQVFKVFLKVALSLMTEEELINYPEILTFLLSGKLDGFCKEDPLFKVYRATVPNHYNPIAFLFKRRGNDAKIPTHVLILMFRDKIYQVMIPYNRNDLKLYGEGFHWPLMPPFHFGKTYVEDLGIKIIEVDLSESEQRREQEVIEHRFDPASLEELSVYDLEKDVFLDKKFDQETIKKIIYFEPGQIIKSREKHNK